MRSFALAFSRVCEDHALHDDEARALGPRATDKRRREHAAGRAAARRAVRSFVAGPSPSIARVTEGAHLGEPRFVRADIAHLCVSISHHDGVAVAAVAVARVGVDLVTREPLSAAFCETAFVDGEVDGWRAFGADAGNVAFAAKEAAAKFLGVGFALPLLGFRASPAGVHVLAGVDGCAAGFRPLTFRVRRLGDRRLLVIAR